MNVAADGVRSAPLDENEVARRLQGIAELRRAIAAEVVGQEAVIEQLLVALLAGGHALLEGVPGLGKTLLIRALGRALHLDFHRVQFTPDLMPSDIIGTEILEEEHGTGKRYFKFQQGPVFTNLLLADELNRTPPKTQSALLEAMQEGTISYAGTTHSLPKPFFVLATQNPLEQAGTYPLPEAQLDRFLLNILVEYPSEAEEHSILEHTTGRRTATAQAVMNADDVLALQQLVRDVHVSTDLMAWINRLVRASRPQLSDITAVKDWVRWGAGPRAGQSLVLCAKARALLQGRLAATREDVQALAMPVLRHRLLLNFAAEADGRTAQDVVAALLADVPYSK